MFLNCHLSCKIVGNNIKYFFLTLQCEIPNECQPMLRSEELGWGSWMDIRWQLIFVVDKIGWELQWISIKEEIGIGIQWMFRMIKRVGKLWVRAIWKIEYWIDVFWSNHCIGKVKAKYRKFSMKIQIKLKYVCVNFRE